MSEQETEKRIATKLIQSRPAVFLDNFNRYVMKSDALASYLTEVPCDIRSFGKLKDVTVTAASVVLLTGNGVTLSLDHTRRWLTVEFDPRTEFAENRKFTVREDAFLRDIKRRRKELLAAILTIWRWGRTSPVIKQGMPIGSFETWAAWCRDPLLTLGCPDPSLVCARKRPETRSVGPSRTCSRRGGSTTTTTLCWRPILMRP